ncbi:LANO_0H00364g1_1 [Lachancea nothofagi CBS 11611]|uniref:Autophagy-related protein 13 n=1 Tax=Lachancea nothofagi CBS 11611 TaxID=1266666 RepID=A0A1G4KKU4_9SACH|nr:LANO_0H00364g1_1 [Lachancea nothofagi CBS 11611]
MTSSMDRQLWELVNNFFLKAALLVCQSKNYKGHSSSGDVTSTNKWFNIETLGNRNLEQEMGPWTSFDGERSIPPLVIETYLDLTHLSPSQSIVLKDQDGNPWNVCKGTKKSEIMLERWLIQLESGDDPSLPHRGDIDAALDYKDPNSDSGLGLSSESFTDIQEIYRQLVLLFRYLYTLVGLLPASDLHVRLSKPVTTSGMSSPVYVGCRVLDGSKPIVSKGRIGLSKPLIATYSNVINETNLPAHLEQRKITPIRTKYGSLRISVSYRRDADFHVNDNEEYYANQFGNFASDSRPTRSNNPMVTNSSLRRVSMNSQRSMSVSPNTNISPNLLAEQSPHKKAVAPTRQFQPFKAGSVGSGSIPQVIQSNLSRNPSGTSVVATLRAQRSSNGSITTTTNPLHESHLEPSSIGSGSLSKYSSSFGRLRRQSSVRRSDSVERPQKPTKNNESPSGDLLEFMKFLDDRKELKSKNNDKVTKANLSSSLLKFQGMKTNNHNLSTDLSMSMSMERPQIGQQRHRSNSHSPNSSFSPSIQYSSIPLRLSQSRSNSYRNDILDEYSSRRGSTDRPKSAIYNLTESVNDARKSPMLGRGLEDGDEEDDLLIGRSAYNNPASTNRNRSTSPGSMRSYSSSYSKNQLPFKSVANFSVPTTMATPAHAKLHKANVATSPESHSTEVGPKKDETSNHADEDDELLFFMSDMNLSK